MLFNCVIGAHANAARTPTGSSSWSGRPDRAGLLTGERLVFVGNIVSIIILTPSSTQKPPHQEALAQIVRIHNSSTTQLDALSAVVYPCKVDVEEGLYDAEDHGDWIETISRSFTVDPIEDVEEAVATKRDEVVAIEHGRDGGLAEELQLWEHAYGFELYAERPKQLVGC